MLNEVYIIAAVRTPIGSFGGSLSSLTATQLGGIAIKGAVEKAGINTKIIDEVMMGCVIQAGLGQAPARQAALFADLPTNVICTTINKVCASGMKSVAIAAQNIMLGNANVIVAGGMESMSNVPYYNMHQRWGHKYGDISLQDGLSKDGLTDVYDQVAMGQFADQCAKDHHLTRADQDQFAIESYKKSQAATEQNLFVNEIIPVPIPQKKGDAIIIHKDEEPYKVNFEKLSNIHPAFSKDGTVTAANASTMNDGAAALVLMSKKKAIALGIQPIAIIKGFADAEQSPNLFTTSPSLALPKALATAGISKESISYFELNEAFSVVGIVNTNLMQIDPAKVNIHGGAVSLGHPLGCSGARILVTLIHILQNHQAQYGAAVICNGGGGASAMILEKGF